MDLKVMILAGLTACAPAAYDVVQPGTKPDREAPVEEEPTSQDDRLDPTPGDETIEDGLEETGGNAAPPLPPVDEVPPDVEGSQPPPVGGVCSKISVCSQLDLPACTPRTQGLEANVAATGRSYVCRGKAWILK